RLEVGDQAGPHEHRRAGRVGRGETVEIGRSLHCGTKARLRKTTEARRTRRLGCTGGAEISAFLRALRASVVNFECRKSVGSCEATLRAGGRSPVAAR